MLAMKEIPKSKPDQIQINLFQTNLKVKKHFSFRQKFPKEMMIQFEQSNFLRTSYPSHHIDLSSTFVKCEDPPSIILDRFTILKHYAYQFSLCPTHLYPCWMNRYVLGLSDVFLTWCFCVCLFYFSLMFWMYFCPTLPTSFSPY